MIVTIYHYRHTICIIVIHNIHLVLIMLKITINKYNNYPLLQSNDIIKFNNYNSNN